MKEKRVEKMLKGAKTLQSGTKMHVVSKKLISKKNKKK